MITKVYTGPIELLKDKTALTQMIDGELQAEFDDLSLGTEYTNGWKTYPKEHFRSLTYKESSCFVCEAEDNKLVLDGTFSKEDLQSILKEYYGCT